MATVKKAAKKAAKKAVRKTIRGTDAPEGKAGRPSMRSPEVVEELIERLSAGEAMVTICADAHMPHTTTVLRWMDADDELAARCARAREQQAEVHHAAMDKIERDVLSGHLHPKAANVVLANKRWRMEKLKPRVYGTRIMQELSGPEGGAIQTEDVTKRDADEFTRRVARLASSETAGSGAGKPGGRDKS